jgi:hypothetical protein
MLQRAVFVAITCLIFVSSSALAEQKAEAKKHFQNGLALLKAENFEAAAVEFETAVKLYPTKGGMFNLANCYKTLERYEEALGTLDLLRGEFGDKLDAEYKATIDSLEAEINGLVARLTIQASETGATLLFNGEQVGLSPMVKPLLVGPGVHDVEARLDGFDPARGKVKLASGDEETVTLQLVKSKEPVVVQTGPDDGKRLSPLFWIGLGGTVAAGVVAGVFWGKREQSLDEFDKWEVIMDDYNDRLDTEDTSDDPSPSQVEHAEDRGNAAREDSIKFKKVAIGTTVAAGVLAAATVVVLIVDLAGDGDEEENDAVSVYPAPNGFALTF